MKKQVFSSSFFLFLFNLLFSQTALKPLLVREVYDFQIGDVFGYEYSEDHNSSLPPNPSDRTIYQRTITNKKVKNDSIIYTCNQIIKVGEEKSYTVSFDLLVTNLDSSIFMQMEKTFKEPNPIPKYYQIRDSTFTTSEFGNGMMSEHYYGLKKGVHLEGPICYKLQYMKGLGMVLDYFNSIYPPEQGGIEQKRILVYYKKAIKEWGNPSDFSTKQPYFDLTANEGAHWFYGNKQYEINFCHAIKGDSVYKGISYKKLYEQYFEVNPKTLKCDQPYKVAKSQLIGLIRDGKTLSEYGKVFYRYIAGNNLTLGCDKNFENEILLFDYNLYIGDTLDWCQMGNIKLKVEKKFYMKLNLSSPFIGIDGKAIDLVSSQQEVESLFIGVGFISNMGLFYLGATSSRLEDYCSGPKCSYLLASNNVNNDNQNFQFSINQNYYTLPTQTQTNDSKNYSFALYSVNGQEIQEQEFQYLDKIMPMEVSEQGIYFAVLFENQVPIGRLKIFVNP